MKKRNNYIFIYGCMILTITTLFPILSILLIAIIVYLFKVNKFVILWFLLYSSIIISLVASLKVPFSDLEHILLNYHALGNYTIKDTFTSESILYQYIKDPLFYLLNKILFEINIESDAGFIFIWTFIIYFTTLYSLFLLYKHDLITKYVLIIVTLFFLFSRIYLELSTHLLRQFVASAFLLLFFVKYIIYNRFSYWLWIPPFIHFSSFIFLLTYPVLKSNIKKASVKIIFIFILFFVFFNVLKQLIYKVNYGVGFFNPLILRITHIFSIDQNTSDIPYKTYIITIIFLLLLSYLILIKKQKKYTLLYNYVFFILLLFSALYFNTTLWLRYSFYLYPIYLIIFAIILQNYFPGKYIHMMFPVSLLYTINLFYYFESNHWLSLRYLEQIFYKNIFFYIEHF